jgi:hypothetical protein
VLFKRKKKQKDGPKLVASIMPSFSGMYKDLLEQENITFICRQHGAGGHLKIITGGLLVPDNFYVNGTTQKSIEIKKDHYILLQIKNVLTSDVPFVWSGMHCDTLTTKSLNILCHSN